MTKARNERFSRVVHHEIPSDVCPFMASLCMFQSSLLIHTFEQVELHQRSALGTAGLLRLRGGEPAAVDKKSGENAILSKVSAFVAFLITPKAAFAITALGDHQSQLHPSTAPCEPQ